MRPLYLNYTGSESLSDYTVHLSLSSSDIPFEKLSVDRKDLLFVDSNNEALPYWIEEINSSRISLWLKFSEIERGKTVFYLYFGNPGFCGESSGEEIFLLFDDFEDGERNTSKWNLVTYESPVIEETSEGRLRITDDGDKEDCGYYVSVAEFDATTLGHALRVRSRFHMTNGEWSHQMVVCLLHDGTFYADREPNGYWILHNPTYTGVRLMFNQSKLAEGTPFANDEQFYIREIRVTQGTSGEVSFWRDDGLVLNWSGTYGYTEGPVLLGHRGGGSEMGWSEFEWALVRKYAVPEPVIEV